MTTDSGDVVRTPWGLSAMEQVPETADTISSPPKSMIRPAIVGATVGALVNAALWACVSALLNLEAGVLATLAGVCTGVGVAVATKGESGNTVSVIAVLGSLASILVGKYMSFSFLLRKSIIDQLGESAAANAYPWSQGVVVSFVNHWRDFLTIFDVIWATLAVLAAWKCTDLAARDVQARRNRAVTLER